MSATLSHPDLFDKKISLLKELLHSDRLQERFQSQHVLHCSYHGVDLTFHAPSDRFIQSLKSFIPQGWIHARRGTQVHIITPAELGFSQEDWCAEASQDCYTFAENTQAIQRDFAAICDKNIVLLICDDSVDDGLFNFLRWFLSEKLMSQEKFVMHSSCVLSKKGEGLMFLGHSGAGKSTIASLSTPRLVLGDDMNILGMKAGKPHIWAGAIGGIFNSMIGYEESAPLASIFWLQQSQDDSITVMDKNQAFQKLTASYANLHWPTLPDHQIQRLFDFSETISQSVKFHTLNFRRSPEIWKHIDP